MKKMWLAAGMALILVSSGCMNPQYTYWKRNSSAPYQLTSDGPAAQTRLRSDFAECATFSYVQSKNTSSWNSHRNDEPSHSKDVYQGDRWAWMQHCMYAKGWSYVTAGQGSPLPSNASLDPFKGMGSSPVGEPPPPSGDYYDTSMPSQPAPVPALNQESLPPPPAETYNSTPQVYAPDIPATTQAPINIQ